MAKVGPQDSQWPTTEAWKRMIRMAMEKQGIDMPELARRCGVTKQAIWAMLGKGKSSSLVPKVHAALGLSTPSAPGEAAQINSIIAENWDVIPEEVREAIRNILRAWNRHT